jgi:hypothetical protein
LAQKVAPESHWPELQILVCVVSAKHKETPSTSGMQSTSPAVFAVFACPMNLACLTVASLRRDRDHQPRLRPARSSPYVRSVPSRGDGSEGEGELRSPLVPLVVVVVVLPQYRAAHIVEERMKEMEEAIGKRDFQRFGELTMRVRTS